MTIPRVDVAKNEIEEPEGYVLTPRDEDLRHLGFGPVAIIHWRLHQDFRECENERLFAQSLDLLGWESGLRESDYMTSTVTAGRFNTARLLHLTAKVKLVSC
jgi:hypothetical protein